MHQSRLEVRCCSSIGWWQSVDTGEEWSIITGRKWGRGAYSDEAVGIASHAEILQGATGTRQAVGTPIQALLQAPHNHWHSQPVRRLKTPAARPPRLIHTNVPKQTVTRGQCSGMVRLPN